MACAEFIGSQVGEGWRLVDTIYEDRGYSGSHMRRAGFRSLLNDIKLGLIDVVVVHRLDRLTRRLADFQQIMAELNAHGVPVVSVTQQIDMSHHVGRLATNIITSFAEFEREMVGQRVKEKRAATLESGRWQEGAHKPIIDRDLWSKVAALLELRSRRGESRASSDEGSIFMLRGRVFGSDGRAMSPWLSSAYKGRKYAYYIPQKEIAEGAGASGLPRLQAANLNDQVWSSLRLLLSTPEQLLAHLPKPLTESTEFDLSLVVKRLMNLEGLSEELLPVHQKRLVKQLIDKVTVHADRLDIDFSLKGLMDLILELLADRPDLVRTYRQLHSSARGHRL